MRVCVYCGLRLGDARDLCPYNTAYDPDWAVSNRIMCDFIHRGTVVGDVRRGDAVAKHRYEFELPVAA